MSRELLSLVLFLLAVLGFVALVARLARAMVGLALNAAESTAATGLAEISERRGDITGFIESRNTTQALRRRRRMALLTAVACALLIGVPPLAGVARVVYAACALLWFLPGGRIRPILPQRPR